MPAKQGKGIWGAVKNLAGYSNQTSAMRFFLIQELALNLRLVYLTVLCIYQLCYSYGKYLARVY